MDSGRLSAILVAKTGSSVSRLLIIDGQVRTTIALINFPCNKTAYSFLGTHCNINADYIASEYNMFLGATIENAARLASVDLNVVKQEKTSLIVFSMLFLRIYMPDGTDGLNCRKCDSFWAYVEPTSLDGGYTCPDCR